MVVCGSEHRDHNGEHCGEQEHRKLCRQPCGPTDQVGRSIHRRLLHCRGDRFGELLQPTARVPEQPPRDPVEPLVKPGKQRGDTFGIEGGQAGKQLVELGEQDGEKEHKRPCGGEVEEGQHQCGRSFFAQMGACGEAERRRAQQRRDCRAEQEGQQPEIH